MKLSAFFLIALIPFFFASSSEGIPVPPPWVQKLIESKSGFKFPETTTPAPVIVYSAAVIPQKGPAKKSPYPYWKWKEAYGGGNKWAGSKGGKKKGFGIGKSKKPKGKGKGGKKKWEEKAM